MFEAKEEITAMVNALFALAQNHTKGDVIPWSDVEQTIGMGRYEGSAWTAINRLRSRLLKERGIITRIPATVGIRLLADGQYIDEDRTREKKLMRQTTRIKREQAAVDVRNINLVQRRVLDARCEGNKLLRRQLARNRNHIKGIRKTQVNPMRKTATV